MKRYFYKALFIVFVVLDFIFLMGLIASLNSQTDKNSPVNFIVIIICVSLSYSAYASYKKSNQSVSSATNKEIPEKVVLSKSEEDLAKTEEQIIKNNNMIFELNTKISNLNEEFEKVNKKVKTQQNKLNRLKTIFEAVEYCINSFEDGTLSKIDSKLISEYNELSPSVTLKLHHMDVKDLRKAFRENDKVIEKVLDSYENRYTTKSNRSIYQLIVIALRSELQNILYNLKYDKLDKAIEDIKLITSKYLKIAGEGNQTIASTLTKFIGEIEYLFISAAKIEYNYYVKREQAKQEQAAIREQMRQEAEERKALEAEKKKIEQEELKFSTEIDKLKSMAEASENEDELAKLKSKILELESQLSDVILKKEDIINLQNGKAGNVYIISNLGSFGENVFKIGMTRRIDPQDRVNELGSASVPFKFDVHSFIFSEDAVALENELHTRLNSKRLNKVNLRKEFFNISIDELEELINEIEPTAEFNKTMLAEEFRQSLSSDEIYTSDYQGEEDNEENNILNLSEEKLEKIIEEEIAYRIQDDDFEMER